VALIDLKSQISDLKSKKSIQGENIMASELSKIVSKVESFVKDLGSEVKKIEVAAPVVIASIQKDLNEYEAPLVTMLDEEFPAATAPLALVTALLQGGLTLVSTAVTAATQNGVNPTSDQAFILAIKALISLYKGKTAPAPSANTPATQA
jgi:hypothetical protein